MATSRTNKQTNVCLSYWCGWPASLLPHRVPRHARAGLSHQLNAGGSAVDWAGGGRGGGMVDRGVWGDTLVGGYIQAVRSAAGAGERRLV